MSSICRTFKDSNDKLDILREILIIFSINYKKFEGFASVFFCSCNFTSLLFYKQPVYKKGSRPDVFCEKGVLRNFAKFKGNHLAGGACNFIKKETLAQVFSCEYCEISKNTFFYRTPLVAASVISN